jgi:hypothetical protein
MNPDAIRTWSPFALVALVTAAALDITGRIGQVGPARFTAYQLLALALAAFAGWLLLTKRATLPRTPITLPVLAFLGTAALSLAFAVEPLRGLVQLASLTSSVVLAVLVVVLLREPGQGGVFVAGVVAVAAVFGVLAIAEWAGVFAVQHPVFYTPGYGIRARVTFEDPNILASFLMTALLLAVPVLLQAPLSRRTRALGWIVVAPVLLGLATTFSRGGLGGLLVGLACVLVLVRAPRKAKLALVAGIVLAVVVLVLAVFGWQWVADNVLDIGSNGSAMNRVYMAEGAFKMWLAHPFGVGLDNYQVVYPQYRDPRAEQGIVESHLAYLTILAETGFLGLAAFLWLLWRSFVRAALPPARNAADPLLRSIAIGAFAASAGLAAQAFTYSIEVSKFWWLAIGLGAAAWRMYAEGESAVG